MIKYQLEFPIKSSIKILYNSISTPSGLSEWFANDVNIRGDKYTFEWEMSTQSAILLSKKANEYIRFSWLEEGETELVDKSVFFELRIQVDEITSDVSLMVTDFAEDEEDMDEAKRLWESQIGDLMHSIGS